MFTNFAIAGAPGTKQLPIHIAWLVVPAHGFGSSPLPPPPPPQHPRLLPGSRWRSRKAHAACEAIEGTMVITHPNYRK